MSRSTRLGTQELRPGMPQGTASVCRSFTFTNGESQTKSLLPLSLECVYIIEGTGGKHFKITDFITE